MKETWRLIGLLLFIVLAMALCGCAHITAPITDPIRGLAVGTAISDAETTVRGLNAGLVEMNPLLGQNPSRAKLYGFKLGASYGLYGLELLYQKQTGLPLKWWQRALIYAPMIAIQTYASIHNWRLASEVMR